MPLQQQQCVWQNMCAGGGGGAKMARLLSVVVGEFAQGPLMYSEETGKEGRKVRGRKEECGV